MTAMAVGSNDGGSSEIVSAFPRDQCVCRREDFLKGGNSSNSRTVHRVPVYLAAFRLPFNSLTRRELSMSREKAPGVGKKYIAIGGNIGAGKSALTRVLSDYFKRSEERRVGKEWR